MSADSVPPLISAQINYLLSHSPFSIKVDNAWSGCKNSSLLDRFTLVIPFCLDFIRWDVIYNAHYPLAAPDIIFGPEDDNFNPLLGDGEGDKKTLKNCLSDWNSKDPTRLMSLIHELRELYSLYQKKRVADVDDHRLKFEISTILSREGIEMYLSSGIEKPEEVKFAVPLIGMDINRMVHSCTWKHQQKIYLQVIFPVSRKLAPAPAPHLKLVSTPELKALFSIEDVKLPSWLDGMCLAEYLPALEETIEEQILEAVSLIGVRRNFIEALSLVFGRPVEADPVFCRKTSALVASGVFTFLVHFHLSSQFPKQQPALILQSSQHFNSQGAPVRSPLITDYPWSPRWELSQMAERILGVLELQEVLQRDSTSLGIDLDHVVAAK
ncbi:BRCA1-A complex subunit BRE [Dillenia turbinata]|uniref:BRISC and BRCA1-A complex member 2 n=1 Tax=Dillenia turbinata TaxID=194707 RepID=A0AAN8VRM6_9MAGN